MSGTLRDQLLKAGFVDKKQARQAEVEKKQREREQREARRSGRAPEPSARDEAAERARQERELFAERSRELNRARDEERARKAAAAEVKNLLRSSAQPHGKGDIRYHFVRGTKVKRIYVDRSQQKALAAGQLAIVAWDDLYYLVPTETVAKVKQRLPDTFAFIAEPEDDADDPYAAFPEPEDLGS